MLQLISPRQFIQLQKSSALKRVVPVDATWFMPNAARDAEAEFLNQERIPNSIYFNIDRVKDANSIYPHMAPTAEIFQTAMRKFGLLNDDILVVYDKIGNFSSPRCAWTFKLFNHPEVYLLNNYNTYKKLGLPLETNPVKNLSPYAEKESNYVVVKDSTKENIVTFEQMVDMVENGQFQNKDILLFDARSNGRFTGKDNEPRPGMSSGHIPGALSLPFVEILDPETKEFITDPSLIEKKIIDVVNRLNKYKIDADQLRKKQIIFSCGTGVTATVIKTFFDQLDLQNTKLYDGSWTEWVLRNGNDSPLIEKDL